MKIEHIWPATLHTPKVPGYDHPPYAQIVVTTRDSGERSVHIAGTFGNYADGSIDVGDMAAQVRQAHENIRLCLEEIGGSVENLVRVKIYVTDMELYLSEGNAVEMELAKHAPATSTLVQIVRLANPDALVEIEAYAELGVGNQLLREMHMG